MKADYRQWLERQQYDPGTISAQLHRAGRVEKQYGDLDAHYAADMLSGVIEALRYSTEDERRGRPNPSKIPFEGNVRNNLASYRAAVERYRRFRSDDGTGEAIPEAQADAVADIVDARVEDEVGQRIGLERDLQSALRQNIGQLENGLAIIDGGKERRVESGFIDITARDREGAIVVIELKAGPAGQRAVAQILSYMGDILAEEPDADVRGLLVASAFDLKAQSASRMAPSLSLRAYSIQFKFDPVGK